MYASQYQETLIINYQDNGTGISEAERVHVFEPFFQLKETQVK